VTAKATLQTLAKSFPDLQLIFGVKLDHYSFGRIFVNMRVDCIILFFGGISQERDDKADFVDFLY